MAAPEVVVAAHSERVWEVPAEAQQELVAGLEEGSPVPAMWAVERRAVQATWPEPVRLALRAQSSSAALGADHKRWMRRASAVRVWRPAVDLESEMTVPIEMQRHKEQGSRLGLARMGRMRTTRPAVRQQVYKTRWREVPGQSPLVRPA
jgi:hypothetical protein